MNLTTSSPEHSRPETRASHESHTRTYVAYSPDMGVSSVTTTTGRRKPASSVHVVKRAFNVFPPMALGLLFLLGWYLLTLNGRINPLILPAPGDVFSSLIQGFTSGMYWVHILATVQESLLGFFFAGVIALPLGYGIARSPFLARLVQPYLAAGQAIPSIVLAPFLFLWLGMGIQSVVVICTLVVLFPLVVNTILGIHEIAPELLEAASLEGAHGWSMIANIEFPLALPSILAAVRTSLTLSITGAMVGEFFCSPDKGLGALLQIAMHQYNMAFMFATVILLALLAALYYGITWLLMVLAERAY